MRWSIALGILLIAAITFVAGAPANAQPAPPSASASGAASTTAKEEARAHFEKGLSLFDEEAWDAALVEFQKSRELFPTRAATKDAGFCLRKLHRFDEALDMFEALLAFPNLPVDDREIAEREVRGLKALVGRIELRGMEPGATVVVDSRARGTSPVPPVRVPAGTHVVRVVKQGFVPFEANVAVAGGQSTTVDAKCEPLMQGGRLKIVEQTGKLVDVLVDNVVVGKTPFEGTLSVGHHTVILVGEGNLGTQPVQAPVRVDEVTALTLAVEPLDARLRVEPSPTSASVAVDGVELGRGLWEGKLRVGAHRVEVGQEGFLVGTRDVTIGVGAHEVVAILLERDPRASLTFKEAEQIRREWLTRGGSKVSYELRGQGIVMVGGGKRLRNGYVIAGSSARGGPYVSDDTAPFAGPLSGGGSGGPGFRIAYMYMALPDTSKGSGVWHAFRVGTGADVDFGYWFTAAPFVKTGPAGTIISGASADAKATYAADHAVATHYDVGDFRTGWMLNVPVTIGYQLAIGKFKGPEWKGAVVGLAYAPSLNVLVPYQFDKAVYFIPYGFEVSVDIVNDMTSVGKQAFGKVFVYVLPPIKDSFVVVNIGGGAVWY